MTRRPETVAWIAILVAFGVLCALGTTAVYAGYQYWLQAADAQWARLTVIQGSVALREPGFAEPIVGHNDQVLREGTTVLTGPMSRAFLRLFDHSTLTLSPDTQVDLTTLKTSRFQTKESTIAIAVPRGKVVIGVAPPLVHRVGFSVVLPSATAELGEGSYVVEATGQEVLLKVRAFGAATIRSAAAKAALGPRQWLEIGSTGQLGAPRPLGQELVFNGDFRDALDGWQAGFRDMRPWIIDVAGSAAPTTADNRPAVRFRRAGSRGSWSETFLFQAIGRDVSDLLSLRLSLDLRLVHQSLAGGGERGSEYPLMVRIDYRSAAGDTYWVRGFYYQNQAENPTTNGALMPRDRWVHYDEPLDLMVLDPKPREILSIQVLAAGHDYESLAGRISLRGE